MGDDTGTAVQSTRIPAAPRLTPEMERMDAIARQSQALAGSTIIPQEYRDNPANCLVAIDVAHRTGVPVLTVCQNLHIISGRPSWSSTFLIGAVNSCGRFTPLRFQIEGQSKTAGWQCRAIATSVDDGEILEGPWVTWEMAMAEKWVSRNGSKWQTMPELMIRYRAAAFWSRLYAPEIALGLHTADEIEDIGPTRSQRKSELAGRLDSDDVDEDEESDRAPTGELPLDDTRKSPPSAQSEGR